MGFGVKGGLFGLEFGWLVLIVRWIWWIDFGGWFVWLGVWWFWWLFDCVTVWFWLLIVWVGWVFVGLGCAVLVGIVDCILYDDWFCSFTGGFGFYCLVFCLCFGL